MVMDFISLFPDYDRFNYLWVVLCQLMSLVHLILIQTTMHTSELAWLYLKEVVQLYGLPKTIRLDWDLKFTPKF